MKLKGKLSQSSIVLIVSISVSLCLFFAAVLIVKSEIESFKKYVDKEFSDTVESIEDFVNERTTIKVERKVDIYRFPIYRLYNQQEIREWIDQTTKKIATKELLEMLMDREGIELDFIPLQPQRFKFLEKEPQQKVSQ